MMIKFLLCSHLLLLLAHRIIEGAIQTRFCFFFTIFSCSLAKFFVFLCIIFPQQHNRDNDEGTFALLDVGGGGDW